MGEGISGRAELSAPTAQAEPAGLGRGRGFGIAFLAGGGERMEQQASGVFEVDGICCAHLPEKLAGAGLLCEVGGLIGEGL